MKKVTLFSKHFRQWYSWPPTNICVVIYRSTQKTGNKGTTMVVAFSHFACATLTAYEGPGPLRSSKAQSIPATKSPSLNSSKHEVTKNTEEQVSPFRKYGEEIGEVGTKSLRFPVSTIPNKPWRTPPPLDSRHPNTTTKWPRGGENAAPSCVQ